MRGLLDEQAQYAEIQRLREEEAEAQREMERQIMYQQQQQQHSEAVALEQLRQEELQRQQQEEAIALEQQQQQQYQQEQDTLPYLDQPANPEDPQAGNDLSLGNFKLLEKIGAGSFGSVFKAVNLRTNRVVALKLTATHGTFPAEREIAALKLIGVNKYVADMRSYFPIDDDQTCLELQFVEGVDLFTYMSGRAASPQGLPTEEEARGLYSKLAKGVAYCHSRGVVHRDLKPEK
jgi:serine/threonine protein kinase